MYIQPCEILVKLPCRNGLELRIILSERRSGWAARDCGPRDLFCRVPFASAAKAGIDMNQVIAALKVWA